MRRLGIVLCCGLLLAAAGCGGGGVGAEGKILKDGNPYTLAENEGLSINLTSEDGNTWSTKVEKDGRFKFNGPPGKYKVSYTYYLQPTAKGPVPPVNKNTSEIWDLTSARTDLTLEIGKK